jgi:N-acyl-D-amino-acid deacylase
MLDILLRNGKVVDGTGAPWFRADVGIRGDRIAAVGALSRRKAGVVIDVRGRVVCPGFVDIHSHSDLWLLVDPRAEAKVRQGVTTEIVGNCGFSASPVMGAARDEMKESLETVAPELEIDWTTTGEYFSRLESAGMSLNCAALVGHGTLRAGVCGTETVQASRRQMGEMKRWLKKSLREGALGLSTGLPYPPSSWADTDEVIDLCRAIAGKGGLYFTHMRGRRASGLFGVAEVAEIARESEIPCQIAHVHGIVEDVRRIEAARAEGLDITFDQYPYTAGSSGLSLLLPLWVKEGGKEAMVARLRKPETRQRLAGELRLRDPASVLITQVRAEERKWVEGLTIARIAEKTSKAPLDAICDLIVEEEDAVGMVLFGQSEKGVREVMRHPLAMVGSDGSAYACDGPLRIGIPHPRSFGTYPRILGHYVRDERNLSLESAVRQMTSAPAARVRLASRGVLKTGYAADIVVFDAETIAETGSYADPHHYPTGIDHILVNGAFVLRHGERTDERPGRVLRRRPDGSMV